MPPWTGVLVKTPFGRQNIHYQKLCFRMTSGALLSILVAEAMQRTLRALPISGHIPEFDEQSGKEPCSQDGRYGTGKETRFKAGSGNQHRSEQAAEERPGQADDPYHPERASGNSRPRSAHQK
jgi:hypothetical protein